MLDLPNISDDEALDRFVRGLKNDVRIHVITRDPNTLEDATRFAIAYESAQQVGMVMPSRKREELPNDPMDLSVLVQQLNALVRSGNNNISNNNNHFNNRQSDRRNFNSGRRSNIICHWCNKSGHVIAECRTRQRDIREFEQTKLRQKRNNFQPRARPNQAYVADLIDIEASNNSC
ncbi:hypothetical protein G6F51_013805 [Rhizopus arrhizus]|uniref:CCHC-type domain-containing protein n=1 Tax=Rhizopus oryzae TaxID=64495 RepID=A0A9P6XQP6_RHIOR|nr:hypothetical protein G6F51_013805 [Rhizopus arrhizus]